MPQGKKIKPNSRIRQKNEEIILAAAEEAFSLQGFKGTSMQQIADLAQLPKPNLHYYFDNKQSLYVAVLNNIIDRWDSNLNAFKPSDDPAVVLTEYIETKLRFSREHPLASRVFAKEILSGAPYLKSFFNQEYHQWMSDRAAVFESWIEQGKIRSIDPIHLILMIWSTTQQYADYAVQVEAALGHSPLTEDDFARAKETLVQLVLGGCGLLDQDSS